MPKKGKKFLKVFKKFLNEVKEIFSYLKMKRKYFQIKNFLLIYFNRFILIGIEQRGNIKIHSFVDNICPRFRIDTNYNY